MKNERRRKYELTQFYCKRHGAWHTILEKKFHTCILLVQDSFRVELLGLEEPNDKLDA